MRITKTKLKKKEANTIVKMVDGMVLVHDFTISADFAKDAYALFKEEHSKRKIFKGYWDLFKSVKKLFVKFKIGTLMKSVGFYSRIRQFLRFFITSKLFYELDKLDPMEALEAFLKMFQPPPPPQPQPQAGGDGESDQEQEEQDQGEGSSQGGEGESGEGQEGEGEGDEGKSDGQDQKEGQDEKEGESGKGEGKQKKKEGQGKGEGQPQEQEKEGEKQQQGQAGGQGQPQESEGSGPGQKPQQKGKSKPKPQPPLRNKKDQKGLSADEGSLPIDMNKFREKLPEIEKSIASGVLEKEDIQKYLDKHAGIEHKKIKIHNIVKLVEEIADNLDERDMDIFYIARQKEITDRYRRDEVLKSVPFPDDEMNIKNIQTTEEILKVLPTQLVYEDKIFDQKLAKKELLIKDYQSRRLKKQVLYLLVDVSGSMEGSRNIYACGVALAFVRQAVLEGSTYFLRFFDHGIHRLQKVKTQKEAEKLMETLMKQPFSGGGTSIDNAIKTAIRDINKDPTGFEKAEIMVITDGEDDIYLTKKSLKGIKVHSTVIEGDNSGLKKISDTYIELKEEDFT